MCVRGVVGTGSVVSTSSTTQLQAMESEVMNDSGYSGTGESKNEKEEEEEDETLTPYDRAARRIKVWRYWPPQDVLYVVDKTLVMGEIYGGLVCSLFRGGVERDN